MRRPLARMSGDLRALIKATYQSLAAGLGLFSGWCLSGVCTRRKRTSDLKITLRMLLVVWYLATHFLVWNDLLDVTVIAARIVAPRKIVIFWVTIDRLGLGLTALPLRRIRLLGLPEFVEFLFLHHLFHVFGACGIFTASRARRPRISILWEYCLVGPGLR